MLTALFALHLSSFGLRVRVVTCANPMPNYHARQYLAARVGGWRWVGESKTPTDRSDKDQEE